MHEGRSNRGATRVESRGCWLDLHHQLAPVTVIPRAPIVAPSGSSSIGFRPSAFGFSSKTYSKNGYMGLYNGSEAGQNRFGHRMKRWETGRKPVGNGSETDGKRVGHGSETGFLQGFSRVSLVFLEVFFRISLGFLLGFFRISFWVFFGILEGLFRVSLRPL